jgi:hypothetical protein
MPILSANTKLWLHGLFAAAISAFSTAASGAIALPTVFSFDKNGFINMAKLAAVPAILAVFAYLKASPLPPTLGPGDTLKVTNPTISATGTISADSATLQKAPETPEVK